MRVEVGMITSQGDAWISIPEVEEAVVVNGRPVLSGAAGNADHSCCTRFGSGWCTPTT